MKIFENIFICQILIILLPIKVLSFFDFFFQNEEPEAPKDFFSEISNINCEGFFCKDTRECVNHPRECSCFFKYSQLKCVLPNNKYICISKPTNGKLNYDNLQNNYKLDANDANVRDCGWISRNF